MMQWAYMLGVAGLVTMAVWFAISRLVKALRRKERYIISLEASNAAFKAELERAKSRLEIQDEVAKKTPTELETSLKAIPPGSEPGRDLSKLP
jgi:hypothetical protein